MAGDSNKLYAQPVIKKESGKSNGTVDQTGLPGNIDTSVESRQLSNQPVSAVETGQDDDGYSWQVNIQVCFLVIYYVGLLLFLFWLLFDFWSSNFSFMRRIGIDLQALDDSTLQLLRTIGFTIIGGALGNILYRIRQMHNHYCKAHFNPRWIGKYISEPWESAAMAIVVLALIHGGIALFTGSANSDVIGVNKVVKWLDYHVSRVFNNGETNNVAA